MSILGPFMWPQIRSCSRTRNIRISLSLSSIKNLYFHLLKTCHPVSSGVSRMRSVALCPHGITMQIGQWNLPQGNFSLRSNVSSNYAQPTSTVTRTHQMHLVGWCELCHMVIVLKQMCQSWMCPRGTWELSRPEWFFV